MNRQTSFCQYTILQGSILEIADVSLNERFTANDLLAEHPDIQFYAGFPLIDPEGYALVAIRVLDYHVRRLSQPQSRALQLIGSQVVALVTDQKKLEQFGLLHQRVHLQDPIGNDKNSSSEEKLKSFFENARGLTCRNMLW